MLEKLYKDSVLSHILATFPFSHVYKIYCFFTIIRLKQREKMTFNIFVLIPMGIYYFFVLSNSHENLLFLCFLVNLIHTYIESSKIQIFWGNF